MISARVTGVLYFFIMTACHGPGPGAASTVSGPLKVRQCNGEPITGGPLLKESLGSLNFEAILASLDVISYCFFSVSLIPFYHLCTRSLLFLLG